MNGQNNIIICETRMRVWYIPCQMLQWMYILKIHGPNIQIHYQKTVTLTKLGINSLWLCLEAITMETSIIQYKRTNDVDIITLSETFPMSSKLSVLNEYFMSED